MTTKPSEMSPIEYYRAIEAESKTMLEAAKVGNWERVIEIEGKCVALITSLRERLRHITLNPEDVAEKFRLMQGILIHDAEIRRLAEGLFGRVDGVLGDSPDGRTFH